MSSNSISLKLVRKNDTRRISIVPSSTAFADLVKLASTLYNEPSLENGSVLRYRDSEQDVVNVTSDIELQEAYAQAAKSSQVLKFWVMDKNTNANTGAAATEAPLMRLRFCGRQQQQQQEQTQEHPQVHHATCDSCHSRIIGIRFKCQQCPDYDLCERCQPKNADGSIHPLAHSFHRIEKGQAPTIGLGGGCPMWRQRGVERGGAAVHPANCDSCHSRIVGVRFKCQQCDDYDLCERCQPKNADGSIHPSAHSFERIEFATRQHWRAAFEATHRAQQQQQQQQQGINGKQEAEVVKAAAATAPVVESKKVKLPANVAPLKLRIVTPKIATEQPVEAKPNTDQNNTATVTATAATTTVAVEAAKPASVVVTTDANDNSKAAPVAPSFEDKLKKLQEMGFVDVQKNIVALVESRGDVYGAVRKLLG